MRKYLFILLFLSVGATAEVLRKSVTLPTLSQDPNGCFADQTTAGAGDLTLDGALVVGGVCINNAPQKLSIEGSGDNSGVVATIVGTNADNQAQTEDLTLSNAGTVHSVYYYKKIESITVDGAVTGNIEGGPLSAQGAVSKVLIPDVRRYMAQYAVEVDITTATYTVEYTFDNTPIAVRNVGDTPERWNDHEVLAGKTVDFVSNISLPVSGFRLKFTAWTTGTGVMTINQERK